MISLSKDGIILSIHLVALSPCASYQMTLSIYKCNQESQYAAFSSKAENRHKYLIDFKGLQKTKRPLPFMQKQRMYLILYHDALNLEQNETGSCPVPQYICQITNRALMHQN